MKLPSLFMLVYPEGTPVRAVFHGMLKDSELDAVMKALNIPEAERTRLVVIEKINDPGFDYTVMTLRSDDEEEMQQRLDAVFPGAKRIPLGNGHTIRDAVRAVVIM